MTRRLARFGAPALLALAGLCLFPARSADAQYFGRNKVQYRDLRFEVIKTEHFDIYFYEEEREAAGHVARMAERWYTRISHFLDHQFTDRQPVILYASHPDFEQTNVLQGAIGEGTGGVTESLKRRVIMPIAGTLADTDHVLGHELVHAFQYDIAAQDQDQPGLSGMDQLPLWMVEGMAEYLSIGPVDPHTAMWIRDASRDEKLPGIDRLDDPQLFPYRWGQALWAYIAGRWGDSTVGTVFKEALAARSATTGIEQALLVSSEDLSRDWHAAIRAQYGPVLEATRSPSTYGRSLSGEPGPNTPMSVSPALSPDGRKVVYFSERGLFSIDLYLADVETGRVIRRLVNTATDRHFTSLQFISSAGSWHPAGHQFVFGAISDGQASLAVVDVDNGRLLRRRRFPELGEILNPSWSPDGRLVAFSATKGGFSDLFVYDLDLDTLRQITSDAFADLHPAWSPDGGRIVFATDRFSTDLSLLKAGRYGLAIADAATGRIEAVPTFDRGKSINPQWAPDGRHVVFLSDRTGLTNLYVVDVTSGRLTQLTDLNTGASGITPLSPALSTSIDARRLVFSAYDRGHLGVYVMEDPDLGGSSLASLPGDTAADVLPPAKRATSAVADLLADASTGLPATAGGPAEPYRSKLSLDYVGQPYVSAGVNQFGPTFGGGLSFLWSDTLGNHNLLAGIDLNTYGMKVSSIAKNTGGLLAYQNLTNRWNWGLSVQQSPYLSGGFLSGFTQVDGELAFAEQSIIQRQTYRSVGGAVAYPFSPTHRIELGGSFDQITFDQEVQTQLFSLATGRLISDRTETTSLADPLHLGTATIATVTDSSLFGATSPIAGRRSRFSLAPTAGSISFLGATADYRRYFMPVEFYTIAGRLMHIGRYGSGGEDSRLLPLFIGYPELVRGYSIGSFSAGECTATLTGSCAEFDRLLGSRMLIGNIEFRFPILRPFGVRSGMYGPVPIEVALFADSGVAWNRGERPDFLGGDRQAATSAGVTFRVNLFGFAIGQIDFVRPFQREQRGWLWAFSFTPGF